MILIIFLGTLKIPYTYNILINFFSVSFIKLNLNPQRTIITVII